MADHDEKSYGKIRETCNRCCSSCQLSCQRRCPCLFLEEESDEEEEDEHDFEGENESPPIHDQSNKNSQQEGSQNNSPKEDDAQARKVHAEQIQ